MKRFRPEWLTTILLALFASLAALADEHMLNGMNVTKPFNVQANLCKLNPGVSEEDYDAMLGDYFDWAKKNNVEPVFVRQKPVFSHANANNPWPYDFVEFLAMDDYERWGRSWDMWLTSTDGAALNQRWQSLAMCNVKQAHGVVLFADAAAMQSDDERYVSWNWCTPKVGWEQLEQKHNDYVTDIKSDSAGMIGWAIMYPHTGGADSPGEFAHLAIYPDIESFMKRRKMEANGGWRSLREYYQTYADCGGEQLMSESVMLRP